MNDINSKIEMELDAKTVRDTFAAIGVLVDEIRMNFTLDGLKAAVVDPANVVIINIDLPRDNFLHYDVKVIEEIGLPVDKINQVLEKEDKDKIEEEPVKLSFIKEAVTDIYILHISQGIFTRDIRCINVAEIRKKPQGILFLSDYSVHLKTKQFRVIIKKSFGICEYTVFSCKQDAYGLSFSAISEDDGNQPLIATPEVLSWKPLRDTPRDNPKSMFSLDYLSDIVSVIPGETTELRIGHDMPCRIISSLGQSGRCEYMIAPRIESEG